MAPSQRKPASGGSDPIDSSNPRFLDSISAAVNKRHEETVALLQELVRVPSVNPYFIDSPSPSREGDVQDILGDRMRRLGAQIDRWEPTRPNWLGMPVAGLLRGSRLSWQTQPGGHPSWKWRRASLLILGHVDVVSSGEGWTNDPFAANRHVDAIFGRGTADMKAGLAAAVGSLEALEVAGLRLRGDVILASVVDEEAGAWGPWPWSTEAIELTVRSSLSRPI